MEEERTIQSLRGDNLWKGGFPLRVVRYDHRRNRRMHQHDFFELVLVTSGHRTEAAKFPPETFF